MKKVSQKLAPPDPVPRPGSLEGMRRSRYRCVDRTRPSPPGSLHVPSFMEQARMDDTLRATLRRTLRQTFGREPTEEELDVQVRQEFMRMSCRLRRGFVTEPAGKGKAPASSEEKTESLGNGTWLSPEQIAEAEAAITYARSQGIDSLVDAVRWYHDQRASFVSAPLLPDCVDEFLVVKRAEGRAPITLTGYRSKLVRFAAAFPDRRPAQVAPSEIGSFILARSQHPCTRLDWWQTLRTFFAWCKRMRNVAENPVLQALAKPKPPPGSTLVFTPGEAKGILRAVRHTDQLGFWVLSMFAGLRTEEIRRLHASPNRWGLVRLRSRVIDLPHEVAKIYARRVPILPVLIPWLVIIRDRHLPFFPPGHFNKCRRLRNEILEERTAAMTAKHHSANPDIRPPIWGMNISRRSFISYRMALAEASYVEIANEVGNSETVIRAHYHCHVTRQDAEAYFALTPARL